MPRKQESLEVCRATNPDGRSAARASRPGDSHGDTRKPLHRGASDLTHIEAALRHWASLFCFKKANESALSLLARDI
jgi:hypothetical protein